MQDIPWNTPASLYLPGRGLLGVTLREAVVAYGRLDDEERSRARIDFDHERAVGTLGRGPIEEYLAIINGGG